MRIKACQIWLILPVFLASGAHAVVSRYRRQCAAFGSPQTNRTNRNVVDISKANVIRCSIIAVQSFAPKKKAWLKSQASINLVAGAGFEPTTFGL